MPCDIANCKEGGSVFTTCLTCHNEFCSKHFLTPCNLNHVSECDLCYPDEPLSTPISWCIDCNKFLCGIHKEFSCATNHAISLVYNQPLAIFKKCHDCSNWAIKYCMKCSDVFCFTCYSLHQEVPHGNGSLQFRSCYFQNCGKIAIEYCYECGWFLCKYCYSFHRGIWHKPKDNYNYTTSVSVSKCYFNCGRNGGHYCWQCSYSFCQHCYSTHRHKAVYESVSKSHKCRWCSNIVHTSHSLCVGCDRLAYVRAHGKYP